MANATVTVLEADGTTETDVEVLGFGRQAATASKSTAASTEDKAVLDAMAASLVTIDGRVDGLEALITSTNTKLDTAITALQIIDNMVLSSGTNNIGDVDIASIAAGDNNIGNVDVVTLPALPAGTNNIGDVDVLTLPALPAGTNNIGDVDVLTVPADPFGVNADAAVAAGAAGSIQAKLRRATQGLEDLKSLIVLATGSNAIGKLAANSGVDIGDVDVTSIAAGDNIIGQLKLTDGTTVADVADLASGNALKVAIVDSTGVQVDDSSAVPVESHAFDVAVTPTVTNGAYSAGDIMGALMTFTVSAANDKAVIITGAQVAFKAAVMPNPLTLILFNADPTSTTKTDNAAYSLNAADTFKAIKAIGFQTLGAQHFDHGTPNTISLDNLFVVAAPATGTQNIYGLLIDGTGVTLTSTSDVQVRLRGSGV